MEVVMGRMYIYNLATTMMRQLNITKADCTADFGGGLHHRFGNVIQEKLARMKPETLGKIISYGNQPYRKGPRVNLSEVVDLEPHYLDPAWGQSGTEILLKLATIVVVAEMMEILGLFSPRSNPLLPRKVMGIL